MAAERLEMVQIRLILEKGRGRETCAQRVPRAQRVILCVIHFGRISRRVEERSGDFQKAEVGREVIKEAQSHLGEKSATILDVVIIVSHRFLTELNRGPY